MSKILCIDDTPNAPEIGGKTLKNVMRDIYSSSPYEVIFETNGEKGVELAKSDKNVKLVFLDIEFKRQKKQGDTLAKDLLKVNPELKVIVLTRVDRRGKKTSLGHKDNVVFYLIKKDIGSPDIQRKLRNISEAIIEDYENKKWHIDYDGTETLTLFKGTESFGINIPINAKEIIKYTITLPNKPVNISVDSNTIARACYDINENVREGTEWKTWGILTKENCAKGQRKLLIGAVVSLPNQRTHKNSYVDQTQFERAIKEINMRIDRIEQLLKK